MSIKKDLAGADKAQLAGRITACIIGNILIGLGVALTKTAAFGNDPFNGQCMAVAEFIGIPYTYYTLAFNTFLFIFEIIWGRRYINIGTFINWFLLCYAVAFFLPIFEGTIGYPDELWKRLLILAAGLLISGLGLAIYQLADLGVAPYDSIPLMVTDYFPKIPFFAARVVLDCTLVVVIILTGGIVSIGTVANAFCLGPIVNIYTVIIRKIIGKAPVKAEKSAE